MSALEDEIFYLMESWEGQTYQSLKSMPSTFRYRMLSKKSELEKKRTNEHNAAIARARSRRR